MTFTPVIDETIHRHGKAGLSELHRIKHVRNEEKLRDYMVFGALLHEIRKQFKSTKLYGQYLAEEYPESQVFAKPLRSDILWLYKAIHVPNSEGDDILSVLGVDDLADFSSANPTVIRNAYRKAPRPNASGKPYREAEKPTVTQELNQEAKKPVADSGLSSMPRFKKPR